MSRRPCSCARTTATMCGTLNQSHRAEAEGEDSERGEEGSFVEANAAKKERRTEECRREPRAVCLILFQS